LRVSNGSPGTNGAILKNSLRRGNKDQGSAFASGNIGLWPVRPAFRFSGVQLSREHRNIGLWPVWPAYMMAAAYQIQRSIRGSELQRIVRDSSAPLGMTKQLRWAHRLELYVPRARVFSLRRPRRGVRPSRIPCGENERRALCRLPRSLRPGRR
ncbi:MAG: hypothetical protein QOI22_562, partial [Verrucomicrobiota bacterium]